MYQFILSSGPHSHVALAFFSCFFSVYSLEHSVLSEFFFLIFIGTLGIAARTSSSSGFETFLGENSQSDTLADNQNEDEAVLIEYELQNYLKEKIPTDEKLMPFWKTKKKQYANLYKVASLFFQIPFTEVNVERLFSNVKFILDPLRMSLTDETLNDIMLIRMNIHLFETNEIPLYI